MKEPCDNARGAAWVLGSGAQHPQPFQQHCASYPAVGCGWQPTVWARPWPEFPPLIPTVLAPIGLVLKSLYKSYLHAGPPDSGSSSLQDTSSWRLFTGLCYGMSHKLDWEQLALLFLCIFNLSSILIYDNIDCTVPSQDPEGARWLKIIHLTLN